MIRVVSRSVAVSTLAILATILTAVPADAGAARTRPRSPSGPPHAAPAPPRHAPQRARGIATYGHGAPHVWGGPTYVVVDPWFYDWWFDPWWSFGFGWGAWSFGHGERWWWYPRVCCPPDAELGARPSDAPSALVTDIDPRRAAVRLNGESVGRARDYDGTWDRLVVPPGRHVLEFSAPGYQTLRVGVDTERGATYRIAYDLQRGEGIDPRSTPAEAPPAASPPRAASEGAAGDERPAPREGKIEKGFLGIRVFPSDAALYLDGEFLARGDELERLHGALPVAAGTHRLEAVRPGYKPRRLEVGIEPGRRSDVAIELEREASP